MVHREHCGKCLALSVKLFAQPMDCDGYACRRIAPPGFRAAPRAGKSSRPFGVNPSRLRTCGAARYRLRDKRPAAMGGAGGLRLGLLRQVVQKRAVPDADGSLPVRHEGRFPDTPPGLAMEFARHASSMCRTLRQGRSSLVVGALAWSASGRKPVKPSRGMPSRPCLHSGAVGLYVLVLS